MYLVDQGGNDKENPDAQKFLPSRFRLPKLKPIGLVTLWACLALSAPLTTHAVQAQNKFQPRQADQAYEKALISFHNGKEKEATIHLKNALQANPRHLPSRILMAEILIRNGDGAGAEIELNFARERGADNDRLIVLFGQSYILQGKNKYLLEVIRNGKRDNAIEAEISYLRGRAYFADKKLANAKRSFAQALALNPMLQDAKLGLAQVAAAHKRYDLAMHYIDSALNAAAPNPTAWILKAKIYKLRGAHQQALNAINQALALDDSSVLSRLTRAALLIDGNKFRQAEADVDFILKRIPQEPRAKYLKAVITATRGDITVSKSNMTEIINTLRSLPPEVMKSNPTYYYLAGLTNFQFGFLDEARISLQQYLKQERDDISAMRLLGALELKAGKPQAANRVLSVAYRSQPNNPTILTMMGLVHLELGNIDKANYYLERVTQLLPDSPEGLTNLARGKMAAGSFDAAIQNLLKAEQHNLNALDVKLLLAKAYQRTGQYDKAVEIARKLKDRDPENAFLLNLYGTAIGLAGDPVEARKSYEKALQLDNNNMTSLIHLARLDLIEGKTDHAIESLRAQLEKTPDDPVLMLELGNIYKLLKDASHTLFWYKKAYSINSQDFATLHSLVDGYLLTKDTKAAIAATAGFIDRFPKHAGAYDLLGKLYLKDGNPTKAIKSLKRAADFAVKRGQALLTLAEAQLALNDRAAATKTLQKAVAWDQGLAEAYIALIKMAIEDGAYDNAFILLDHLRSISKEASPVPDILAGDLYAAQKDYPKAAKSYLSALKSGDDPAAAMGLYRVYQLSGRSQEAISLLEDWNRKHPEDLRGALALSNAYKRNGQMDKALRFLEKLLQKNPNQAVILNNAANIHFLVGNEEKALEYAREANRILPDNANILDTLAWIETRRGHPETALPLLRKAQVLRFSDPEIKYHLALTLDKLDRRGEAQKLLAEAVSSSASFADKTAAEQTLTQWRQN